MVAPPPSSAPPAHVEVDDDAPIRRAPRSLAPWLAVAAVGHLGAAGALVGFAWVLSSLFPPPPLDPADIIEVTMMESPPAPEFSAVPRNATRAVTPAGAPATPADAAAPAPPPPVQSDMVVPQAPEAPEVVPPDATDAARAAADAARRAEADRKRADAMRQLALESAFDELAEPGDRNQRAGGPTVDASSNATQVWGPGMGDAELQRYIALVSKLMSEQFHPLPALLHQGYQTKLIVEVDDAGRVLRANVSKSSGNASYDQAAKQAAVAARVVPPPPAKYQDGQPNKYYVTFSDPGS